ncbi:MAG TPA: carboxypeptidase regulatory-like domain-containing protein, partial [Gemmataceae bacterium]|nr:carboxypeptidase regulatory-like domain-containing protein [Gemmataceae bacterium]
TATGLSASNTGMILLQAGGGLDNSKITGVVTWDTKLQPGRPVTLKDGKGKVIATTETNMKGVYVFANVQPGTYRVIAAVPGILQGNAPATVTKDKGETVKADVNLKRIP